MFDLRPIGGSFVILIPLWSTVAGKTSDGYDVNHSLNELWELSYIPLCDLISICSQICSNRGIQDGYRWQFWRRTQEPTFLASWMTFSAIGPWFWPSEMLFMVSYFFFCWANELSCTRGSVPGRMKIRGVPGVESRNDFSMSKIGGVRNSYPISYATYY